MKPIAKNQPPMRADRFRRKWPGLHCFLPLLLLLSGCTPLSVTGALPASPPAQELVFYDWEGDLPQTILDAFTREYGIQVKYEAYESQEDAIQNMQAGKSYDLVVMESRFMPMLIQEKLLTQIDYQKVPNFKNISADFRDLAYDPNGKHSVPYSWGTTGLVVRKDLVNTPVTRWKDLWDPRYAGRVAIWFGAEREVMALTLKSLGYSVNSEDPAELNAALQKLLELKPHVIKLEDIDPADSSKAMASGKIAIAMGYYSDLLVGGLKKDNLEYVLPADGALLWGDVFVIPANSPQKSAAELLLNFILRPEINAKITNEHHLATPDEAARPFIEPEILNDPQLFPSATTIKNAEIILPLSRAGQTLYDRVYQQFLTTEP